VIELKNLSKYYSKFKAIDNISFEVEKGQILGLLGPNGAGKTTTMRIITGYMPPSSGYAKVCGIDVYENPIGVKKNIGYLPETIPLYTDMKTVSYLEYVAKLKDVPYKKLKHSVDKVIDICGLSSVRNRLIANLSKGYKQRVGLAQSLINEPKVLILDEPTSGLDPKQIIDIRNLIKNLAGEHTIILSTHILPEVTMTCSKVAIINNGKVVAIDAPDNLSKHLSPHDTIKIKVSNFDNNLENIIKNINGVLSVNILDQHTASIKTDQNLNVKSNISKAIIHSNYELYEFKQETYSLEDVFLNLTTEEKEEDK